VVEYCLSRSLSPAMVAQYERALPDKELLKAKLHELYQLLAPSGDEDDTEIANPKPTKPKRRRKGGAA